MFPFSLNLYEFKLKTQSYVFTMYLTNNKLFVMPGFEQILVIMKA